MTGLGPTYVAGRGFQILAAAFSRENVWQPRKDDPGGQRTADTGISLDASTNLLSCSELNLMKLLCS